MTTTTETPTRRRSLYEIGADIRSRLEDLKALAEENGGEVPAEMMTELLGVESEREAKVLDIAAWVKEERTFGNASLAHAKAIAAEAAKDVQRAQAHLNLADRLSKMLADNVPPTFSAEDFRVKVKWQGNGGVRPVRLAEGRKPEELPEEFRVVTTTMNAEALRDHLQAELEAAGGKAPEVTGQPIELLDDAGKLLATVEPRGKSLRIS